MMIGLKCVYNSRKVIIFYASVFHLLWDLETDIFILFVNMRTGPLCSEIISLD